MGLRSQPQVRKTRFKLDVLTKLIFSLREKNPALKLHRGCAGRSAQRERKRHAEQRVRLGVERPVRGLGARVAGGDRWMMQTSSSADRGGSRDPQPAFQEYSKGYSWNIAGLLHEIPVAPGLWTSCTKIYASGDAAVKRTCTRAEQPLARTHQS